MPPTPGILIDFFGFFDIFDFWRMECVDMTILRFGIFRQNLIFEDFRPDFSSEGHFWVVRSTFSIEKSIYGSYGPISSSGKSIYGSYGPYISGKALKLGRQSVQFLKRLLTWVVSQVNFWKGSLYRDLQSVYFWWEVHIVVLWVSELILWVSELMLWVSELKRCTLGVWTCALGVWTYLLGVWT